MLISADIRPIVINLMIYNLKKLLQLFNVEFKFNIKCRLPYLAGLLKFLIPKNRKNKILQPMRFLL